MAADGVGAEETERLGDWAAAEPSSYTEWCLGRIANALEAAVWVMEQGRPAQEERPAVEPGTPLPEDFPAREKLAEAGVIYLEALPRKGERLAALGLNALEINRVLSYVKTVL